MIRKFQSFNIDEQANILFVAVATLVAALFVGFALALVSERMSSDWSHHAGVSVWTDSQTGCRYTRGNAGMTPLLGPDGRPDCARRP